MAQFCSLETSSEKFLGRRRGLARAVSISAALALGLLALLVAPRSVESKAARPEALGPDAKTSRSPAESLKAKIQELSVPPSEQPKSFEPIVITEEEANSYLQVHGPEFLPPAVESPEIHIHAGHVSGAAEVDFEKLQKVGKQSDDVGAQVLAALFKGKQKVTASGKLETADGHGQVTIENLTIGTTAIPDWLTKLMIESYVQKNYNVDLSKPFALPDHVTRIELAPGQATFLRSPEKNKSAAQHASP